MTYKNAKIVLFASLMVAMILPFSGMMMAEAATNENANDKAKFKNHEADKIMKDLSSYIISKSGEPKLHSANDLKEMKKLQDKLEKSQQEHKERIIDKELREDMKEARKLISKSDIPTTITAVGIDHVYIQLTEKNTTYENEISVLMGDTPYVIDYGNGLKRGACESTQSDCDPEIGGLEIQIDNPIGTDRDCSISIPMQKDGSDGFLTAGHCFTDTYGYVYQPIIPSGFIGYSLDSWQSFENNGECDCAWIIDYSATVQQNGVFAYSNAYWVISSTEDPEAGDLAMLRGQHNNNGNWWESDVITYGNIGFTDDGVTTLGAMAFPSPFQAGDSGGAVFYNGNYIGIAVAGGLINGVQHTVFIPWQHITENLSGLSL